MGIRDSTALRAVTGRGRLLFPPRSRNNASTTRAALQVVQQSQERACTDLGQQFKLFLSGVNGQTFHLLISIQGSSLLVCKQKEMRKYLYFSEEVLVNYKRSD